MTRWQRRTRLAIALFAIGFAALVAFAFRRRAPVAPPAPAALSDPNAVVESTGGRVIRLKGGRTDVTIDYEHTLTYRDGSSRLGGVRIVTTDRGGARTFTITAKEGRVEENETGIRVDGNVVLSASDGLTARTEHAAYTEQDGVVRAPGPVEFARGRLAGTGVGMTYDKNTDVLVVLDRARIQVAAAEGGVSIDVSAPRATLARRDHVLRFEGGVQAVRNGQTIEADAAVAHLGLDDERVERVELRGHARIAAARPKPGSLQALAGRDMDLVYAADGETLEHVAVAGDAILRIAGVSGAQSRQVAAGQLELSLAPDGSTPTRLAARESVQLVLPAEQGSAARTIGAAALDARGDAAHGLTTAAFTGAAGPSCQDRRPAARECDVDYREQGGAAGRAARARSLDLVLTPGMSGVEEARFSRSVRFEQGRMSATAAAARYLPEKGILELSGRDAAAPRPHVVNEQIAIDATRIDVTLAGPKMKATGDVRSVLQAAKDPAGGTRTPAMLKADQAVNIVADALDYDGAESKATYSGRAKLWQADTSIQGRTLSLDNKKGDMAASGQVTTTALLEQRDRQTGKKQRIRSIGTAQDFQYEDSTRRATYSGQAHLSGPQGDITADTIELYLQPSGDEVDRAIAYGTEVTLREQDRKTTGERLAYTSADDTYVVTGAPLKVVDACGRETIGRTLRFLGGSDTVIVDGGGQVRTQTKSSGTCR